MKLYTPGASDRPVIITRVSGDRRPAGFPDALLPYVKVIDEFFLAGVQQLCFRFDEVAESNGLRFTSDTTLSSAAARRVSAALAEATGARLTRLTQSQGGQLLSVTSESGESWTTKHKCDGCGTMARCQLCAACKAAHYCSKDCQRRAWPAHRHTCRVPQLE